MSNRISIFSRATLLALCVSTGIWGVSPAQSQDKPLVLYGAGSLREAKGPVACDRRCIGRAIPLGWGCENHTVQLNRLECGYLIDNK